MSPFVQRGDIITYISQIEFEKFKIIIFSPLVQIIKQLFLIYSAVYNFIMKCWIISPDFALNILHLKLSIFT